MENYLWWKRRGVLILILVFFVLTATVLSFSVFYDQTVRVYLFIVFYFYIYFFLDKIQEISCQKNDLSCMETLCPYGWTYIEEFHKCKLQEGILFPY